jgi:ankyrin repeat protein
MVFKHTYINRYDAACFAYQQDKMTPLHFAADSRDEAWGLAIATLLLDRGADIEAKDMVW